MTQENAKIVERTEKKRSKRTLLTPLVLLLAVAIALFFGYVAGMYHYQIESAIGPIFGYKSHSSKIDFSSLQETYDVLAAHYDGKLDTKTLIEGANRGMVAAVGDDYTVYMSASESTSYNNSLEGNIGGGIGAIMGLKNNQITIMQILDNNPAKSAGLQTNDVILKINDQSTDSMTVDKAVSLIRGDKGTTVKLNIKRGDDVKDYVITRATISNPSVTSSVSNGVGIMTITRFDDQTGALAKTAAQSFVKQGVKSVILDLRDNGGGYVSAATDVAGLWLNNQVIVTERTGGVIKETLQTDDNAILAGIPTAVLVNSNSASASEIVAGALQDHGAAKLVGENTFGKGCVQDLLSLSNGSQLKVTVARWYTPNGKNITKKGITPDVMASLSQADVDKGIDPQMDAAKKTLGL
jgi:carboxyl-terminal processing protease